MLIMVNVGQIRNSKYFRLRGDCLDMLSVLSLIDTKQQILMGASQWRRGRVFNLRVVTSNASAALMPLDVSHSVPITELSEAMVCGALSMGHCTQKTPCHS